MNDFDAFLDAWTDAERSGDAAATGRLLTDDFIGIGPLGFQPPKPAWLQRQTGRGLHYDELSLDEVTTRFHGNCAVTTARWNAKSNAQGRPIPEAAGVTLTSVQDRGEWQLASIHYSFIAGTPGAPGAPGAS
ncbi:nuclear transport factor 2 family protein [Pseudarthrobacter sp. S9]|uniref:nuclear transport factor 2 family protein n=1 Tax=Pseudarthrobacter sp. S9 TaxID=3418421 RepID=UPI003D023B6E